MVLESTMICVDSSDYMRNGDFIPTRLRAQQDVVGLICHSKIRSNPENNVGILTLSKVQVLATLCSDAGKIVSKLHQIQPEGNIDLITGLRIAQLALKHRQGKNHKMRIVAFVGSPLEVEQKELVQLAKRLKKEKVNVDVVSFGEEAANTEILTVFVNTLNGKEGGGSHLVTVPPGPSLSDALITSAVIQGEDGTGGAGLGGAGFEYGIDPNEDPELALALRVSLDEQRLRQEQEARRAEAEGADTGTREGGQAAPRPRARALGMSAPPGSGYDGQHVRFLSRGSPDFSGMSEEEQIALAIQMSLQQSQEPTAPTGGSEGGTEVAMDVEDYKEVINDPEFLQSVLENLPGVDPEDEAVRKAVDSLNKDKDKDSKEKKDKDKDKGK